MIKTAGRIVTETELRTYTRCSQLHYLGGTHPEEYTLMVFKYVFEALTSHSVRKDILDPLFLIQKYVQRAVIEYKLESRLEHGQVMEIKRHVNLLLSELFQVFDFKQYIPIYGPFEYRTRVAKTPITLRVSGLYRSNRNQTLHIVCFTPYENQHGALNDPTTQLKLQTLKRVVKPHASRRPQAKLHIFGATPHKSLLYTSQDSGDINTTTLQQLTGLVRNIERGNHFPLVPCPYPCKFKRQCYPEKQ
jgi:hypothetical protein